MKGRRDFLKGACATAALCGMPARIWGAARMLGEANLVVGVLSDIHIAVAPKGDPLKTHSATLFRHALEYFRDRHVDGVLISGDLTHRGLEAELKTVADIWFEVFPGGRLPDGAPVANLMHYGDHDAEAKATFHSLKGKGYFARPAAVVLCDLGISGTKKERKELVCFLVGELSCPVFQGYPYGHVSRCYAIDYGRTAEISPDGVLSWKEGLK